MADLMRGAFAHPGALPAEPSAVVEHLAACGVDHLRLAAMYHSGRWLLADGPVAVRYLDDTITLSRNPGRWKGVRLQPPVASGSIGAGFEAVAAAARRAGLATVAWTVGTHNTTLATANPDLAHTNAYGDVERHALCPAAIDTQEYLVTLLTEVAATPGIAAVEVEAASWYGWRHAGHHDKAGVPVSPGLAGLLSLCFCAACRRRMASAGLDVGQVATAVQRAIRVRSRLDVSPREAVVQLLGDLGETLVALRDAVQAELLALLAEACDPRLLLIRATGAAEVAGAGKVAGDLREIHKAASGIVFTALDGDASSIDAELATLAAAAIDPASTTFGLSLLHPAISNAAEITASLERLAAAGVDRVVFYAVGLAPAVRWAWTTPTTLSRRSSR